MRGFLRVTYTFTNRPWHAMIMLSLSLEDSANNGFVNRKVFGVLS